jgi:hypothetical protein
LRLFRNSDFVLRISGAPRVCASTGNIEEPLFLIITLFVLLTSLDGDEGGSEQDAARVYPLCAALWLRLT